MAFSRAVINFVVNTQAARQQIQNFKNNISTAAKNISNNVVGKFGGLVGLGGGLKALTDAYQRIKQISDLSSKFKLPVQEVSKFSNTMSLFGASTEESLSAIENIQQAIIDYRTTGGGALKAVAAQVGLSLTNADGSMKNSMQVIEDLRQKFKGLSASAQVKVAQELGLSNPAMLRMLRASDEEYAQMKAKGSSMNVVTEEMADKVQKMNRLIAELKLRWQEVGGVLINYALKGLRLLTDGIQKFNELSKGTQKTILTVVGAFLALAPAISIIKGIVSLFVGAKALVTAVLIPLKLMPTLIAGIGTAIKAITLILATNPIVAAIMSIIAAIVLCIRHWDDITAAVTWFVDKASQTLDTFGNWCLGIWRKIKEAAKEAWGGIVDFASKAWGSIIENGKVLLDWLGNVFDRITSLLNPIEKIKQGWNWAKEKLGFGEDENVNIESGSRLMLTRDEVAAAQQANTVNSNNQISKSIQNIQNSNDNRKNTVQTFNFYGSNDDMLRKVNSIVRQNATGVI